MRKTAESVVLCGICAEPMTESDKHDPQGPQSVQKGGKSVPVHADCYFDRLADAVEDFPILPPRLRRKT